VERDVLRNAVVSALHVLKIEITNIIGNIEEHVCVIRHVLESAGVVWELESRICGRCVAQQNANSARILQRQSWVVPHDISVRDISDKNKCTLRESLDDSMKQDIPDLRDLIESCEIARTGIEGTSRKIGINELFVGTSTWLW